MSTSFKDIVTKAKERGVKLLIAEIVDGGIPSIWMTEKIDDSAKLVGKVIAAIVRARVDASKGTMEDAHAILMFFRAAGKAADDELAKLRVVDMQNPETEEEKSAAPKLHDVNAKKYSSDN